jgi:hypothetical protein
MLRALFHRARLLAFDAKRLTTACLINESGENREFLQGLKPKFLDASDVGAKAPTPEEQLLRWLGQKPGQLERLHD